MNIEWQDLFGTKRRRARRRKEFMQILQNAEARGDKILRVNRVYQKARTGQKAVVFMVHEGPVDVWFPYLWPAEGKALIVRGSFSYSRTVKENGWHHHNSTVFFVRQILGEIPPKVWNAGIS